MSLLQLDISKEEEIKLQSDHKLTTKHRDDIQSCKNTSEMKQASTRLAVTTHINEHEK
jgi:hypothetical protein